MSVIEWPGHRPNGTESARLLLEAGADVDARRADDQGTPLSGTACTNEVDTMRVLLDFGADVHAPCGYCPGSVLDFVKRLAENIAHRNEFRAMADLFANGASKTSSSAIPTAIASKSAARFERGRRGEDHGTVYRNVP